jgi:hypothetical protein
MPTAAARSWKALASLAGVVPLAASLGTLAGDHYLQAWRAARARPDASRVAGPRVRTTTGNRRAARAAPRPGLCAPRS